MASKINSFDDKIKLPVTETISRFYQPQQNRKAIRILTVAVYVLCVSLAAIMLSLYYIFIWDPTVKPFMPKVTNCDKIVIPEQIAIRLTNYTEISAEQFYKNILKHYQQQQQRRNIKYRKNFILNIPKITNQPPQQQQHHYSIKLNETILSSSKTYDKNFKLKSTSKIISSINKSPLIDFTTSSNTFTIPDITILNTTTTTIDSTISTIDPFNDEILQENPPKIKYSKNKSNINSKQKISEPFMKSLQLYHNRRVNSDDEDYTTDEYNEASGHYIMDDIS